MNTEPVLTEIRSFLDNGDTGAASDVLFKFLLDNLGKPTAIDLPTNIGILPPKVVISHLRRALNQLLQNSQIVSHPVSQESCQPEDFDLTLILQTSGEYEARQKEYIPGEENQVKPRSLSSKTTLPTEFPPKKLLIDEVEKPQFVISERVSPNIQTDIDPVTLVSIPEILQDEDVDESIEVFTEFNEKNSSEPHSDGEWLLDDDLYYDDEEDDRADLVDVEHQGKISRQERAWQIAYSLGTTFDWDNQGIALLQQVFIERGWQQARVAMEFLMQEGMTSEQLMYAKELRENWELRPELTIAFYYTRADRSNYCYSGEKILSWRVAVEIIKSVDGCNDFDEVEQFIEESLDAWYSSGRLRHDYKSFLQYLRSVAEHRECLSSNLLDIEPDEEPFIDTNDHIYEILNEQLQENGYGINLRPDIWRCAF